MLTEMRCIVERNVFCVNRDVIDCCCYYKNAPLMSKNIPREQNSGDIEDNFVIGHNSSS